MHTVSFEEWVVALRSGNYEQGTGTLKRKDCRGYTHCCLGVLCDIADVENYDLLHHQEEVYQYDCANILPEPIDPMQFISMNDFNKNSFDDIANFIEEIYINV